MPTLYFCVFEAAAETASGDPVQEDTVTISGVSAASAPVAGANRMRKRVRLLADGDCFATWGSPDPSDPVAQPDGTNGRPLQAGVAEYFDIESGHKIAVIERSQT